MKNYFLTFVVAFAAINAISSQIVYKMDSTSKSDDTIHVFYKGATVQIGYDSAFVMNPKKFKKYKALENYYEKMQNDPTPEAYKRLGNIYFAEVDSIKQLLALLDKNNQAVDKKAFDLANETQRIVGIADKNLEIVNKQLDTAIEQLKTANKHLENAEMYIKREQRNRWWKNALWAGGGAAVGYLIKTVLQAK